MQPLEILPARPAKPQWKGRDSLEVVYRFNERCIKLLTEVAAHDVKCEIPAIACDRDLWRNLDGVAHMRVARFSFVMLDLRFQDEKWWRGVAEPPAEESDGAPLSRWPRELAEMLTEETLLLAAQIVNWDLRVASVILGMAPRTAELLRKLTPQQVRAVWRRHSGELRLRWENHPEFWRPVLVAAMDGNDGELMDLRLQAKLRLYGELLATCE